MWSCSNQSIALVKFLSIKLITVLTLHCPSNSYSDMLCFTSDIGDRVLLVIFGHTARGLSLSLIYLKSLSHFVSFPNTFLFGVILTSTPYDSLLSACFGYILIFFFWFLEIRHEKTELRPFLISGASIQSCTFPPQHGSRSYCHCQGPAVPAVTSVAPQIKTLGGFFRILSSVFQHFLYLASTDETSWNKKV